jgi:ParB-like chromosome segregation protein Spo0J
MSTLRLDQIEIDPTLQIRQRLDESAVERYSEAFAELPPPVVYLIDGTYLLSDGMHRLAAANRLGLSAIEVEVRKGTRADAEEHAITANTKNAVPLTASERDEGIRRLLARGWGIRKIAKVMSLPLLTAERIVKGQKVRENVSVTLTSRSHYEELSRFPEEIQEPVALAAAEQGWNSVELRDVAKQVAAQPDQTIYRDGNGQVRVNLAAIQAGAKQAADNDALAALYGLLSRAGSLRENWDDSFLDDLDDADRRQIERDVEDAMRVLTRVLNALERRASVVAS